MILSQLVADADLRAKYSDDHYEEEVEELFRQKFSNNLQMFEDIIQQWQDNSLNLADYGLDFLPAEEGRARQRRHGAVEVRRRPEARRADHGQPPVVRLGLALRLELVGREARREADGVPDGQFLRAAAGHVVRLLELGPELDQTPPAVVLVEVEGGVELTMNS